MIALANILFYMILGEVNAKTDPHHQISPWGVNTKLFFVLRQHKRVFPTSARRTQLAVVTAVGLAAFIAGASKFLFR